MCSLMIAISLCSCSNEEATPQTSILESPLVEQQTPKPSPRRNAYFGDLHVHSAYSLDSYVNFNPAGPREAYRFARGEAIMISGNRTLQLQQPLDFTAVTEHGEYLGELALCLDENTPQYNEALCLDIRNEEKNIGLITKVFKNLIIRDVLSASPQREKALCGDDHSVCLERAHSVWQELREIADEYYEPGKFTTFVGYEWTGNPLGRNLHRNIIFRNQAVPPLPISYFEANTPEKLWQALRDNCQPPCELISIPHNSNQSRGQQFPSSDAAMLSEQMARLRSELEPLVEVIQAKGESECHTGLGTADEFCDFEKLERRPLCEGDRREGANDCAVLCDAAGQPEGCVWANNYVRNALKDGLRIADQIGVNPYQFGLIASTDTHNGTPGATDESHYVGHHGVEDGTPEIRATLPAIKVFTPHRVKGSGGLAGVWAEENTRDSIFAALKRKETFATSGTRIVLRFFAGWDLPDRIDGQADLLESAYLQAVPMGGELSQAAPGQAPTFLVWAMKGSDGARLQRIQIIKGWLENGQTKEQTFDVACSDGLQVDANTHGCPDNGAKVNLQDCSISADKGAIELKHLWQDPGFDPAQAAFYYVRVLENPTCRWSSYEAVREGRPLFDDVDSTIQERAWSSAIWYTP